MKQLGDRLTSSEGRRVAVVAQAVLAVILLISAFVIGSTISEYEDKNYYGRYDDEIKTYKFLMVGAYIGMVSQGATALAISSQNISVYEKVINGTARKTMYTNRVVEIDYEDIRDVRSTRALVIIRTTTDEIHFCVNNSEYVAGQIRYQWNKRSNQTKGKEEKN